MQGRAIDIGADELAGGSLEVEEPRAPSPSFWLVAPNPIRGATTLHYALPSPARVTLTVYDLHGRVMDTPIDREIRQAGLHDAWLRADLWPAGCYFLRLTASGAALTRRMSVVK